jgi:hypothetical protein
MVGVARLILRGRLYPDFCSPSCRESTSSELRKTPRLPSEQGTRPTGKKSNFEMGAGTRTRYQHDARRHSDGTISIFDNGGVYKDDKSCGLMKILDMDEMTASLVRKYAQPQGRVSATKGNMQVLLNGNAFIGWGSTPLFSEFISDGELLFNASFSPKSNFTGRSVSHGAGSPATIQPW